MTATATPHAISAAALAAHLFRADAPCVVDVRTPEDFAADPRLIPGARRLGHRDLAAFVPPTGRALVVTCQKGLKLSRGGAALLIARGFGACWLDGGTEGWTGPTLAAAALPDSNLWAAPATPVGLAADWLVARTVPDARTLLVAPDDLDLVADRFAAAKVTGLAGALARLGLASPALTAMVATLAEPLMVRLLDAAPPAGHLTILDALYAACAGTRP